MLVRELITRFGFDVEENKLDKLDGHIAAISASLTVAGGLMASLPLMLVNSRQDTERALGGLASVGVKDLDALEERAKQFSNRWAGFTKSAFIEAAYVTKSALSTLSDEAVGEFTSLAALTAKATKATLDEMIVTFSSGYGIFKPLFKEMSDIEWAKEFTAQVSKTANIFNSDGKKISMALQNLGGSASAANVPMAEQLAILGALQTVSSGSESGTLYKSFILNAGRAGEALNLSFTDSQGRLKSVVQILDAIKKRFPDIANAAAALEIKKAFGSDEAYRFIVQLISQMDALRSGIEEVAGASRDGTRAAEEMATAMQRGMGFELLRQQISNLFETMGKPLQPGFDRALQSISAFVIRLDAWAAANPKLSATIITLTGVMGVLIFTLGSALGLFAAIGLALPGIAAAAAAMGVSMTAAFAAPIAAVLAVAAGLMVLALAIQDVYTWIQGGPSVIGEWLGSWEDFKTNALVAVSDFYAGIVSTFDSLTEFFSGWWDTISSMFSFGWGKLGEGAAKIGGFFTGLRDKALGIAASAQDYAGKVTSNTLDNFKPVNTGGNTQNISAPVNVNVAVPPGTPESQAAIVQDAARIAIREELSNVLREAAGDFPRAE